MSDSPSALPDGMATYPSDLEDADFGALEMFDSNMMAQPFSSPANAASFAAGVADAVDDASADDASADDALADDAPADDALADDAPADEAMPPPSSKKHRRHDTATGTSLDSPSASADKHSKKKRKKSKRDKGLAHRASKPDDSASSAPPVPENLSLETPLASARDRGDAGTSSFKSSKKKRKLADSADGKRRKKRRSRDQLEAPEQGVADFLHTSNDAGIPSASAIDDTIEPSDPQKSPTVAHLRRRSQSREAVSGGNSAPPEEPERIEATPPADHSTVEYSGAGVDDPIADVEVLAREAWTEHRNGQGSVANTQQPVELVSEAQVPEPTDPSSSTRRSSRKKAKPTFFEQPPDEDQEDGHQDESADGGRDALTELPSPTAMTPEPRGRSKAAAKKTSKGKKPKRQQPVKTPPNPPAHRQSDEDESDARDYETGRARRNRLVGFTQGRFSDSELARIAKAVENFRVENNLTQQQVNQMIHAPGGTNAGEDHAQLWTRIFAECPDRHRQKLINISRKKFHNFVARGTWTPLQDAELTDLIRVHGTKWSRIASIINRHPEDLRDRYRNYLVCGENQRKDAWSEAEEAQLTQFVISAMDAIDELRASAPNPALLDLSYEELIDWQNISERMGRTRSRLQCITKWKSLNIRTHGKDKLISVQPDSQISFRLEKARRQIVAMPEEEKFRLVLAIQATGVAKDTKIPWQRLVDKRFRNQWHRPTQMLLWRRLRQAVSGWDDKATRDCAAELVEQYNQSGELPDVNGDGYDNAQEMEFIQSIPVNSFAANMSGVREHGNKSAEFVADSDVEADVEAAAGNPSEHHGNDDLNIDPALAETPAPAKKATVARRTGTGKPPSRKTSVKAPTANMDPIEDDDSSQEPAADEPDDDSEIEAPPSRRQKTPRRFRSPLGRSGLPPVSAPSVGSDSAMDDMDDLPAKVPL